MRGGPCPYPSEGPFCVTVVMACAMVAMARRTSRWRGTREQCVLAWPGLTRLLGKELITYLSSK